MTVLASSIAAQTCSSTVTVPAKKDIVDTALAAGSFKTLATALGKADLVAALKGEGPFTVFAPTDEAFAKLPKETIAHLLKPENKAQLAGILTYHVVPGSLMAARVVTSTGLVTLNGQRIEISADEHGAMVDGARISTTDIECSNGVIHVIDSVILPASDNLVDTASKAGVFNTLLKAVKAAGLAEALMGDGPFTVFAPTDEAFARIDQKTLGALLEPANREKLASILKYHVVPGRIHSTEALKAGRAKTLQGQSLTIGVEDGVAMVGNARLVQTDVDCSNAVIHVIDTVLMPAAKHDR
ncbi:MAG: fasciclin domain-containing protein [Planctomycetes bacterium]|nr:fasciclin domain-containing protein [Planctomycetota bacterium]